MSVSWFTVATPLPSGPVRVGVTAEGVVALSFGSPPDGHGPDVLRSADEQKAQLVGRRLAEYFAGGRSVFDLPIDWRLTTGPQRVVLQTLQRTVGFGQTITYGELATRSGAFANETGPGQHVLAARAVGSIMGSNPLFLLVPCHRVVAADGLGGFGGGAVGMEVKRWLLTLEGMLEPTLDWDPPDWNAPDGNAVDGKAPDGNGPAGIPG